MHAELAIIKPCRVATVIRLASPTHQSTYLGTYAPMSNFIIASNIRLSISHAFVWPGHSLSL